MDLAQDAAGHVRLSSFRPRVPGPVGFEAEFFVLDDADPSRVPSPSELRRVLAGERLAASALSFEPGGQLELSARPAPGVEAAVAALAADIRRVGAALGRRGLRLRGGGVDATRTPRWWGEKQRYDAMAGHFARSAPDAGRTMMTASASLQVNLEAGRDAAEIVARWQLAHLLGPVLSAAFANSPVLGGVPTGVASARLQAWAELEACRTEPVPVIGPYLDPGLQWERYARRATVLHVPDVPRPPVGVTLADWLAEPGRIGRPATRADVDYHLTTLFPPVRPRGYLEIRYLDQQRLEHWPVAAAVTTTLLDDATLSGAVREAALPVAARWGEAARCGLGDAPLRAAAEDCLALAAGALRRLHGGAALADAVEAFRDRYTARGRCPADDAEAGVPALQGIPETARTTGAGP